MAPITELELRQELRVRLANRIALRPARVVEEFGVERGAARIDVALFSDHLEAYEIKSDLDSFGRLHNQIHAFNRVFNWIWIVTGQLHAAALDVIVPSWWGILAAERRSDGSIGLHEVRNATPNPLQDAYSLAALLWRNEAAKLLEAMGFGPVSGRASRTQLWERVATVMGKDELRQAVARLIAQRAVPTVAMQ